MKEQETNREDKEANVDFEMEKRRNIRVLCTWIGSDAYVRNRIIDTPAVCSG